MKQGYNIEKSIEGLEISRKNCNGLKVSIVSGLCRANKENPLENRNILSYDKNVLNPMIQEGKISDGSNSPYDDRKMRYDSASFQDCGLIIKLGHSHFLDVIEKKKRSKEETQKLTKLGEETFGDKYAFFGRNPGVTGIILTSDRKLILGERQVEKDMYEGLLQGIAGNIDYQKDPSKINLEGEMIREINEEVGISREKIKNIKFLGVFSIADFGGDDLDFCYLVKSDISSNYFTSGRWKEKVEKAEHKKFVSIENYFSLKNFILKSKINKKTKIIFSTLGALENIIQKDFE